MWRGLLGLLFLAAAVGCFMAGRYGGGGRKLYFLIDFGWAAVAAAAATQMPGVAAFFYSYVAVLIVTLGVNGFFVLAASLAIASALSYFVYSYLIGSSTRSISRAL